MSVTTFTVNLLNGQTDNIERWIASVYSADWGASGIIKAAPGAGLAYCIEQIDIMGQYDDTAQFGEGGVGAVMDTKLFEWPMNLTGGGQISIKFLRPIELSENKTIRFDSGPVIGTEAAAIVVRGFTRRIT